MRKSKIALVRDNTKTHAEGWQAPSDADLTRQCGLLQEGDHLLLPFEMRQLSERSDANKAAHDLIRCLMTRQMMWTHKALWKSRGQPSP